MYSDTVVRPIPTALPICRGDNPASHFRRSTSSTFRMDNLFLGICNPPKKGTQTTPGYPVVRGSRWGWPDSSEPVAAFRRNRRPDSLGISGRFRSESVAGLARNTQKAPASPKLPKSLHGRLVVGIAICYAGSMENAERVIKPVREFGQPLIELVKVRPYRAWQRAPDGAWGDGFHNEWMGIICRHSATGRLIR